MRLPGSASVWIVGATALVACVLACLRHPPAPLIHDEFSYLLAGDTFASGRVANPAHPLWEHFETMHVLQQPTYASKYLPGQGLFLALGTWVGRPIVGVWLSMALAAMAVAWMLEGWVRRPWPLVGGLLLALHPQLAQAWGGTFWGGGVALAGGAIVWGALPRLVKDPRFKHVAALVLGGALLAISRPYEGLVACLPVAGVLFWALGGSPRWLTATNGAVLFGGIAAILNAIAFVSWVTTGDPLTLPYAEFHRQYEVVPLFPFLPLREAPEYLHEVLRTFYLGSAAREYAAMQTTSGLLDVAWMRIASLARFFLGLGALPVLVGALATLRDPRVRLALVGLALGALALCAETFHATHYAAPFVGCGVLLVMCVVERFWEVERWRFQAQLALLGLLSLVAVGHWLRAEDVARDRESYALSRRGALIERLAADGGQHLVVVRYAEDHNPHLEWVWNAADVDRAPVVWAREMDATRNARLLSYFAGREAWLFEPDRDPERLAPYPVGQ